MSASALPGKNRSGEIIIEMNKKTSINFISSDLWPPAASQLHGLTIMQLQRVHQMMFRKVNKFKKQLVESGLV